MSSEVLTRLVIALGLIALGAAGCWTFNRYLMGRNRNHIFSLLQKLPNQPIIVYFTTPDCVPCKTVQRPALRQVGETLGDTLKIIEIDATERPEIAKQWGVMSVPTTFLLDRRGTPRFVNHGVTRADKLFQQLSSL